MVVPVAVPRASPCRSMPRPAAQRNSPSCAVAGPGAGHGDLLHDRGAGRALRAGCDGRFLAEQDDAVGQLQGLVDVVGDEQHRGGGRGVHVEQQVLHLEPGEGIQGAERFVEQEHTGVPGQGTGQGGALGHATGDGGGPVPGERGEAHEVEQFGDAGATGLAGGAARQTERHVVGHGAPGQQPGFLKTDGATGAEVGDGGTVDLHRPGAGGVEAAGDTQQRGLAATARAENGQHLAGPHRQRHVAEDRPGPAGAGPEGAAQTGELHGESGVGSSRGASHRAARGAARLAGAPDRGASGARADRGACCGGGGHEEPIGSSGGCFLDATQPVAQTHPVMTRNVAFEGRRGGAGAGAHLVV
jgi:hypothetical protein